VLTWLCSQSCLCKPSAEGLGGKRVSLLQLSAVLARDVRCYIIALLFKGLQLFQVLVSFWGALSSPVVPTEPFASRRWWSLFISPVWVPCSVIYRSPLNEKIAPGPFVSARPCFVKMQSEHWAGLEEIAAGRRGRGGKGSAGLRFNPRSAGRRQR